MTGLFTPWGTMPFKAADLPTIEELSSGRSSEPAAAAPAGSATDAIPADISNSVRMGQATGLDPCFAPSRAPDGGHDVRHETDGIPPPVPSVSPFSSGSAAMDREAAESALPHPTALLLRLIAVHERISQGEALARAVAFYAGEHVGLRLLADAAEDIRAKRAARHGNLSGKS